MSLWSVSASDAKIYSGCSDIQRRSTSRLRSAAPQHNQQRNSYLVASYRTLPIDRSTKPLIGVQNHSFVIRRRYISTASGAVRSSNADLLRVRRPQEQSASCIVAKTASGSHTLTIDGYSRIKQEINDGRKSIRSGNFTVGGHVWCAEWVHGTLMCKQHRCNDLAAADTDGWIFMVLHHQCTGRAGEQVSAKYTFSLLDGQKCQPTYRRPRPAKARTFSATVAWAWTVRFVDTEFLQSSSMAKTYLRGDRLSVRCDVTVYEDICCEDRAVPSQLVVVPPPDIGDHLGRLLATGVGADLMLVVAGVTFAVHRRILAVRTPELLKEIMGSGGCCCLTMDSGVEVEEARVFKALLHYIYTDSLPLEIDGDEGEKATMHMARHLIAAANRYSLDRLKLICEDMLWRRVDTNTVAPTLVIAEQYDCHKLKKACVGFLVSGSNLKAAMATAGFECLRSSCPSVLKELLLAMVDRS